MVHLKDEYCIHEKTICNKKLTRLHMELKSIEDERNRYIQEDDSIRMGLWRNSTYLDELLFIKTKIEREINIELNKL